MGSTKGRSHKCQLLLFNSQDERTRSSPCHTMPNVALGGAISREPSEGHLLLQFQDCCNKRLGDAICHARYIQQKRKKTFSLSLEVGDARYSVLKVLHHLRKKEAEGAETHLLVTASTQDTKHKAGKAGHARKKRTKQQHSSSGCGFRERERELW